MCVREATRDDGRCTSALRAGKKGARPAEVGALASVFEKSATELKQKLLKCKQTIQIATFNVRPPHMAKQKQDDQPEPTYSSYVRTRDVTQKTCRRRWMIGRTGERWSGISVLAARHDDDDEIYIYIYRRYC